jgi:hypothetical protein
MEESKLKSLRRNKNERKLLFKASLDTQQLGEDRPAPDGVHKSWQKKTRDGDPAGPTLLCRQGIPQN